MANALVTHCDDGIEGGTNITEFETASEATEAAIKVIKIYRQSPLNQVFEDRCLQTSLGPCYRKWRVLGRNMKTTIYLFID